MEISISWFWGGGGGGGRRPYPQPSFVVEPGNEGIDLECTLQLPSVLHKVYIPFHLYYGVLILGVDVKWRIPVKGLTPLSLVPLWIRSSVLPSNHCIILSDQVRQFWLLFVYCIHS